MANNANQISGVGIKKLWWAEVVSSVPESGAALVTALATATYNEVKNVHQDTWTLEEAEPNQDSYKNQLTGAVYRMGTKTMGDITIQFTIGRYDYQLKADLLGGSVVKKGGSESDKDEIIGWSRARGIVDIYKTIVALTEDEQYVVFPYVHLNAREANTDGAIGLGISGMVMEPQVETIMPEYWYDGTATAPQVRKDNDTVVNG